MMARRLLLLSYWFPPNNVIGASRAAAMARYFSDNGWAVTVVAANSGAVSRDFEVDLSAIEVHRVEDTPVTKFMNFKSGRARWRRALSALARYAAFPDAFRSTTRRMGTVAEQLMHDGETFDVIMSTALPFSQHEVAGKLARKFGALLVLDNRDTWACSAYRRRLPFSDGLERRYEHRVLSAGDMLTTISDGMRSYFCKQYPDLEPRFSTIRNGADADIVSGRTSQRSSGSELRIVYTGILYGAKRDIRPMLNAARDSGFQVAFDFFGSEPDRVAALKANYPTLRVTDYGRVPRAEAMAAQRSADALLVGLGQDPAEKTFLPGKFFEYVGTGRPIIVIADPDYEISQLVDAHGLGVATRDADLLNAFLGRLSRGEIVPRDVVPEALTRDHQLGLLERCIDSALEKHKRRARPSS
jgi:hypothetical protein